LRVIVVLVYSWQVPMIVRTLLRIVWARARRGLPTIALISVSVVPLRTSRNQWTLITLPLSSSASWFHFRVRQSQVFSPKDTTTDNRCIPRYRRPPKIPFFRFEIRCPGARHDPARRYSFLNRTTSLTSIICSPLRKE